MGGGIVHPRRTSGCAVIDRLHLLKEELLKMNAAVVGQFDKPINQVFNRLEYGRVPSRVVLDFTKN